MKKNTEKKTKNYTVGVLAACTLTDTVADRILMNSINNQSSEKMETGKEYTFTDLIQYDMTIEDLTKDEKSEDRVTSTYLTKIYDRETGHTYHSLSKGIGLYFNRLFMDCGTFSGCRISFKVVDVDLEDGRRTKTVVINGVEEKPRTPVNNAVALQIEGTTVVETEKALESAEK